MSEFKRLESLIEKKRNRRTTSSSLNPAKKFKLTEILESLPKEEEKKDDKGSSSTNTNTNTGTGRKKTRKKKGKKRKTRKRRKSNKRN